MRSLFVFLIFVNYNLLASPMNSPSLPSGLNDDKQEVTVPAVQQTGKTVSGVVSDSYGDPLAGVNITVRGTTTGQITDLDGKYSLQVPGNDAVLVYSFIGFISQSITVGSQTTINVVLKEDAQGLEEVVVVGFGTQKKVNLTGSVSAVKVDESLSSRSLTSVTSGLQGLLPGLSIAQNTGMAGSNDISMMVRGVGTVNNANPLVVVDGMPDVNINRINMADIETISILKDAASSAIYGSRAANGVILITTRNGKGSDRTSINFTGSYGVSQAIETYGAMPDYPRALTVHQRRNAVNTLPQNQIFKNGTIDQWMALSMIDPLRYPHTDWWDIIMRDGVIQNYNLSASGGNDKSNFFTSIGYMDQQGLQLNNDFTRYNARFNYDYKVKTNMNVGVRFDGNWSNFQYYREDGWSNDGDDNGGFNMRFTTAGTTPYDPETNHYGGAMAYNENASTENAYTWVINNLNHRNRQEANTSIYWDWSPIKGLTARVDYALSYYNQFEWSASIPNQAWNFQTNSYGSRVTVGENAGVSNNTQTGYKTQTQGRIDYDLKVASAHQFHILGVYSEEYWYQRWQSGSRQDRLHPSLHEIDGALTSTQNAGGRSETEGLRSYIARANYTAYDRYLLELNFRADGSSKFAQGHQWGYFPSAAIGWRFTEEDFLKPFTEKWLTSGKFRLSYGTLGNNSGVGRYEQKETLTTNNYMIGGSAVKGFANSKMINKDLTWETTAVTNAGLDLAFLNGHLTTELDYYDRLTSKMNRPSQLSILLSGAYDPAPRKNIGSLRNRGVEANITWRDKQGDFNYMVNLNASYNKTRLEEWNEVLTRTGNYASSYVNGSIFLDMPYMYIYSYKDQGIAQTWDEIYKATPQGAAPGDIIIKDINGDGRIDDNDKVAYPNFQRNRPTTEYGLNASVAWKGFDLAVLLQGTYGRKNFWLTFWNDTNFGYGSMSYAATWDHWNLPWTWDNRNSEWPRLSDHGQNRYETTFWLDDLSYVRLKNLQLGYNVPKNILKFIKIENVRIYGSAENLFTLTKFRGLDPEKAGNINNQYPLLRSYSMGINISL